MMPAPRDEGQALHVQALLVAKIAETMTMIETVEHEDHIMHLF